MNLLGWAATFGNDVKLEAHLAAVREDAEQVGRSPRHARQLR